MRRGAQHTALIIIGLLLPVTTFAFPYRMPEVQLIDSLTGEVESSFLAFSDSYIGGVEVLVADVNGDGVDEYVVAQTGGPDANGRLRVVDHQDRVLAKAQFQTTSASGLEMDISAGDVDADGKEEVVVSFPDYSVPVVFILNEQLQPDPATAGVLLAFSELQHGAAVAVGDVTGDGVAEIVLGTGSGTSPRVRISDSHGTLLMSELVPFAPQDQYGLSLATIDTTGDNVDELAVGFRNGGQAWVKNYVIDPAETYPVLAEFRAFGRQFTGGVQLDGVDVDGDGTQEIAAVPAGDQQTSIALFRGDGVPIAAEPTQVFEDDFRGGAHIAVGQLDSDPAAEFVVSPRAQRQRGDLTRGERYIEVDLSDQVEQVWENGYMRNVYLVSTGLPGTPTPPGEYEVLKKIENHYYSGEGYSFPNTKWNLRFINGGTGRNYYLHTAYWHNNFGRPMSHGCVNMREQDARFIYDWADIGTPVWVHE